MWEWIGDDAAGPQPRNASKDRLPTVLFRPRQAGNGKWERRILCIQTTQRNDGAVVGSTSSEMVGCDVRGLVEGNRVTGSPV